jgi:putative sugar O-methyltransferase
MIQNISRAVLFTLFSVLITTLPLQGYSQSISETTSYPNLCQRAAEDDTLFANFKQNSAYRDILEHVTYEQGQEYLRVIQNDYPELLSYLPFFKQNDTIGNPKTYVYSAIGRISPTTLRYIKVAGDLQRAFGDKLRSMHVVEIGGGYGGQCKILSDIGAFASYTLIDLPQCNALSKKYLSKLGVANVSFIDSTDLESVGQYDLVISNYAFSEIDRKEQSEYLEKIVKPSPYGYMTLNFVSSEFKIESYTLQELTKALYKSNKKGHIDAERPLTNTSNVILTWTPTSETRPSVIKKKTYLSATTKKNRVIESAVTYDFSGGRFGDNLVAYFHTKWLAREYGLAFLYKPFQFADKLKLSDLDQPLSNNLRFAHHFTLSNKNQAKNAVSSTLITVPYFPDSMYEYDFPHMRNMFRYYVDWEDPLFKEEVIECLQPKNPVKTLSTPEGYISVAVHVRRGGNYEDSSTCQRNDPPKFPPDSFYISQLQFVSELFKDQPLYIYIFTDDLNPEAIAKNYAAAIQNPNAIFDWNRNQNIGSDINEILSDFYFMSTFDCLIRSASNFSIMSSMLGDHALIIAPSHFSQYNGQNLIDNIEIKFKTKDLPKRGL